MGVSTSGYYKWKAAGNKDKEGIRDKIIEIFKDSKSSYGYRRIKIGLKKIYGIDIGKKKIIKIMKEECLVAKAIRKYNWKSEQNNKEKAYKNIIQQRFKVKNKNEVWLSDITYIMTKEGWLYLAVVMDLWSRRIIGYKIDNKMDTWLVLGALQRAIKTRDIKSGLIIHTDQGSQYRSKEYKKVLAKEGIIGSMSRKGCCYDNSPMESFNGSFKVELGITKTNNLISRKRMIFKIIDYIEVFYNRNRYHSALNYETPVGYENKYASC